MKKGEAIGNLMFVTMKIAHQKEVAKEFKEIFGEQFYQVTFQGVMKHFNIDSYKAGVEKFTELAAQAVHRANTWGLCYC